MTTHAPLRSQRTKAISVCHVQVLGDGDSPTSSTKDTRLLPVGCKPWLDLRLPLLPWFGFAFHGRSRRAYACVLDARGLLPADGLHADDELPP